MNDWFGEPLAVLRFLGPRFEERLAAELLERDTLLDLALVLAPPANMALCMKVSAARFSKRDRIRQRSGRWRAIEELAARTPNWETLGADARRELLKAHGLWCATRRNTRG